MEEPLGRELGFWVEVRCLIEVVASAQVGRKEDPKQNKDGGSKEVVVQDTKRRCLAQITVKLEGERQGDAISSYVGEWKLDKGGYLGLG